MDHIWYLHFNMIKKTKNKVWIIKKTYVAVCVHHEQYNLLLCLQKVPRAEGEQF